MSDDLIKALREGIEPHEGVTVAEKVMDMAADEIERLTAELQTCRNTARINLTVAKDRGADVERLRAALQECVNELTAWNSYEPCLLKTRRALEQKADTE